MKKVLITILISVTGFLGWFFYEKPQPPFGAKPTPIVQAPTYFAEIDENGVVLRVLVVTQEFINTGKLGDPKNWIETTIDGSKNYAGPGFTYDKINKVFISPKPYNSWILDQNFQWKAPVSKPIDGKLYKWDEETLNYKEIQ